MPEPEYVTSIDVYTKKLLGDSVIYVSRNNTVDHLCDIYKNLFKNRGEILKYRLKTIKIQSKFMSWEERIQKEIIKIRQLI